MKKILSICALVMVLCLAFVSCANIDPNEYVKLGKYKGIEVEFTEDYSVSDKEIDDAINAQLKADATEKTEITDRPVQKGDNVNVDYKGTLNGKPFEGGSAQGADLVAEENGRYIKGFAEALIGHKKGETFDAKLTFPKDYHAKDLAGKEVTFTYTINKITVPKLPELTDAYVKAAYNFESVAKWKEHIKKSMSDQKKQTAESTRDQQLWDAVIKGCKFEKLPQSEIQKFIDRQMEQLEQQAGYYGMDVETMLSQQGYTKKSYLEMLQPYAESYVKENFVMQVLSEKEKLAVTDEEYVKEAKKMAEEFSFATLNEFEGQYGKDEIRKQINMDRVMDFLRKNAKYVEPKPEKETSK